MPGAKKYLGLVLNSEPILQVNSGSGRCLLWTVVPVIIT